MFCNRRLSLLLQTVLTKFTQALQESWLLGLIGFNYRHRLRAILIFLDFPITTGSNSESKSSVGFNYLPI